MIAAVDVDEQIVFGNVVKDGLGVEPAIIVADTGVITPDDQVGAAHVLAEYGVQHGLARAGVQHVEPVSGNKACVWLEVQLNHLSNGGVAHVSRDVALFQFSEQHMDYCAIGVNGFHGHFDQALMGTVHGVTSLEGDNGLPSEFLDFVANLCGGAESFREILVKIGIVEHLDGARYSDFADSVEGIYAGMLLVVGAEDLFGHHCHLIIGIFLDGFDVLNGDYRIAFYVRIKKGNTLGVLYRAGIFNHAQHRGGQKNPFAMCMSLATAKASALFIKPVSGLKISGG